jgi:hypothetical protein
MHIFAMLGLFVVILCGTINVIISVYFLNSPLYCHYSAKFLRPNKYILGLFLAKSCWSPFAESCLQSVPSVGSARGQRKRGAPYRPKSWTAQSLWSAMWFDLTLWCLRWIVFMRLFRLTTGDTSTPVLALFSPGWSDSSMPTWRWRRMMIVGWYCSPLLTGTSSLLIPRSSVTS